MSPEKYAEMIIEAKKRRDESQGCTIPEPVRKWLESNGIDADTLLRLEPLLRKYDNLTDKQKARFLELKDFESNPGKATLTQVGETKTFLGGDNRGLPIYKEDIDMIKKSGPLAKKLMEMNNTGEANTYDKTTEALRTLKDTIDEVYPGDLNTGPDTTENIQEIRKTDEVWKDDDWKNRSIFNERGHDTSDVMWYFDPESQKVTDQEKREIKRAHEKDVDTEECNKNVSQDEEKKDPGDYYKYSTILKRMDETHTRKNNDYGDAAYRGYKKFGDYYFMVQLHNKYQRLESLTIGNKTQQVKEESIDDTLLDMANYAIMFLESRHRDD